MAMYMTAYQLEIQVLAIKALRGLVCKVCKLKVHYGNRISSGEHGRKLKN